MNTPAGRAVCVRALIEGRVQGVFYRAWAVQEAQARGLSGWIRNRTDGSVEALFCGAATAVEEMVGACRQGPPKARVVQVTTEPVAAPETSGFRKLPTL